MFKKIKETVKAALTAVRTGYVVFKLRMSVIWRKKAKATVVSKPSQKPQEKPEGSLDVLNAMMSKAMNDMMNSLQGDIEFPPTL
jgi:hypothetical protein